ncbi:MAG: response regulator transcription factor [Planctomycetota bacterium]
MTTRNLRTRSQVLSRASRETHRSKPRILVVEDDRDTAYGLQVGLSAAGHEVFLARDGESAVSLNAKLRPDLMVLDLGLPGCDGLETLERLRLLASRTPVLVLSAWDEERYEPKALEAGARGYLQKPVLGQELLAAVESILGTS